MLEPHSRQLLLDALRPPDDYALDFAVGTTFSLDLLALLTAPLGFTRFELQHSEGTDIAAADAHVLLRTIREFADKITIFCQAGRIAVPSGQRPLLSALEQMVVEVTPAAEGRVFHPKVWALRFSALDAPVRYRLLVSSRNLTFASSWDTLLVLDGELLDRTLAIKDNHPLGGFFAHLPHRAVRGASAAVRARIAQLQEEIRKVRFECPKGIDEVSFHPFGIPGIRNQAFDERVERLVVVSPFLAAGQLAELGEIGRKNNVLISRLDSLQKLSAKQLSAFSEIYSMSPDATVDAERTAEAGVDPFGEGSGLHAKLYVGNDGWNANVWTGSANATNAAFGGNVELLVQLRGPKSKFGVETLLERREGVTSFRDLLVEFKPSDDPVLDDPVAVALEELLERARTALASAAWTAFVSSSEQGFDLRLKSEQSLDAFSGLDVRAHPITLNETRAQAVDGDADITFAGVSTEAITSFFAFAIDATQDGVTRSCAFVVNARLEGAPPNRQEVLLRSMLRDRRQLIRFILLLLGDADDEISIAGGGLLGMGGAGRLSNENEVDAVLEPLLRALDREPSRLDHVDRLLKDLGESSEAIPEGLQELVTPILEARRRLTT